MTFRHPGAMKYDYYGVVNTCSPNQKSDIFSPVCSLFIVFATLQTDMV